MDSKSIEILSVSAVKDTMALTGYIDAYINDNDKEPSWDGELFIYKEKEKPKNTLLGKIPVQIKGVSCHDFPQKEISHQMSTADLRNYLNDGGVLLFVVYVNEIGEKKIYFNSLSVIKLRILLNSLGNQQTKAISLEALPSDSNEVREMVADSVLHRKKQSSFSDVKLMSFEDIENNDLLENLSIPFSCVEERNSEKSFLTGEKYFYATLKGSSIPQPLDMVIESTCISRVVSADVAIGEKVYYKEYKMIQSRTEDIILIGDSIRLTFKNETTAWRFTYKESNMIRVIAKDLEFLLDYVEMGYFSINNQKIPIGFDIKNLVGFDIESQKEILANAKNITQTLDTLNCDEDIDINNMKPQDWQYLEYLISAFVKYESVKILKDDLPEIITISVGNLKFIVVLKSGEEKGTYTILDFFHTKINMVLMSPDYDENKIFPVSQFCILREVDFLTINNIDFDVFLPSFKECEKNKYTFDMSRLFLIKLLVAYDKTEKTNDKKRKMLNVCEDISNWILNEDTDEADYQLNILNQLQVIKRKRTLNDEELSKLYNIVENRDEQEVIKTGAYLLLDQQRAAEIHFENLSELEKEEFTKFPIYYFWKNK